jgi:hypothetical protein
MKLFKASVTSNIDFDKSGKFSAMIYGQSDKIISVTYTSPFYSISEGGVFAIPSINSEVLIVFDDDLNEYFYLCTIVAKPRFSGKTWKDGEDIAKIINNRNVYSMLGIPRGMTVTDQKGAGLLISNFYEDQEIPSELINSEIYNFRPPKGYLDPRVQLQTAKGHKVTLSDNPSMDNIIISNKDNDRIVITSRSTEHQTNSIVIESQGSQRMAVTRGEYKVSIVDGSDITLENKSTGSNVGQNEKDKSGNINLKSDNRDINIYTTGGEGKILLSARGGGSVVQVRSDGSVSIFADGDITVKSGGTINFVANQDINLNANGNINIRGSSSTSLTSSNGLVTVGGSAGSNIGLSGRPLNLNSGISTPAPNLDTGDPIDNAYGK